MVTVKEERILPEGWKWVRLGEVCEIIAGQSPPSGTYRKSPEGLPFFQGKADFGVRYPIARTWCVKPLKIALPGDILISVRAPVGPTNIADAKCCIGRGLAAIRPGKFTETEYLLAVLKFYEGHLASLGSGSTFSAINMKDLKSLIIPLPPLSEQKRIVAILNEQMALVEKAKAVAEVQLEAAKALSAAYLRKIFPQDKEKKLPEGWKWVRLGEVCNIIGGSSLPQQLNSNNSEATVYCLKVSDLNGPTVTENRIIGGALKTSELHVKDRVLGIDAIIFPKRGGAIATNKKRLLGVKAVLDPNLMGIEVKNKELLDAYYLFWWFQSWDLSSIQSGNTVPQLNQKDLSPLSVPVPPLSEQKRIAAILKEQMAEAEKLCKSLEGQLETIKKLPAALLRRAFRGEL